LPIKGPARDRQHQDDGAHGHAQPVLPPPRALGTAIHIVGGKPDQAGHHLGQRQLEAIARFAQIGRQDVHRRVRDRALGCERKAQGRWKAALLQTVRIAFDHQWDHGPVGMARFEQPHLFVDIPAARRMGRGQENERLRFVERGPGLLA